MAQILLFRYSGYNKIPLFRTDKQPDKAGFYTINNADLKLQNLAF